MVHIPEQSPHIHILTDALKVCDHYSSLAIRIQGNCAAASLWCVCVHACACCEEQLPKSKPGLPKRGIQPCALGLEIHSLRLGLVINIELL